MYRFLRRSLVTACGLAGVLLVSQAVYGESHAVLVAGLGGEDRYTAEFTNAVTSVRSLLIDRYGYDPGRVRVLAETASP